MQMVVLSASIVGGLMLVGLLLLIQSVMQGFQAGWTLPFSAWWGLVIAIPGIFVARDAGKLAEHTARDPDNL